MFLYQILDTNKKIEDFANAFSTLCNELLSEIELCDYEYETVYDD